jgi:protein TonB
MAERIVQLREDLAGGPTERPTSDARARASSTPLDDTLSPTATERLLAAGSPSVYVFSRDTELVATVTDAGRDRVSVHVIWSFRELRRRVESRESGIVLLDADLFEGSLRSWIEELCALESILVLVAASRASEWTVTELLVERLVYRLLVKPALLDTTRIMLDVAVSRHLQLCARTVTSPPEVEVASDNVATAASEILPQNEFLAMRAAAARRRPITALPRPPVESSKTYWPAWFLALGLVGTIFVGTYFGDFAALELLGASGENRVAPSEPTVAEPVDAEAPPADPVVGRIEVFLPDQAVAPAATETSETPPDRPPAPPATARVSDAVPAREVPVADAGSPFAEPDTEPSDALPPAPEPPAASPPAVEPPAVEPPTAERSAPAQAAVGTPAALAPPAVEPPAPGPAAVPATTPELEGLLVAAKSRIRENALLAPSGDSARDYVAHAVELAPSHPDVAAIRLELGEAVAESARFALESGDRKGAETLAEEAVRSGASDETLALLDLELVAAREVAQRRMHSELLRRGVARVRADRLIAPENDNALAYLGRLRAENPNYPGLDSAWEILGKVLVRKVEESAAAADWAGAEAWLEPLALVEPPATIERVRAELAVKRLQTEYLSTPAAQDELRLLTAVDPVYPEEARDRGIAGWVDVELIVGTGGIPRDARVVAADPPATFDQAALAAVSLYRYEPFERDGRIYERLARLRIRFGSR